MPINKTIKNFADVVILDDNIMLTNSTACDLEAEDITVCEFNDVKSFLNDINEHCYKFYIIDYHLNEEVNGVKVIESILDNNKKADIVLFTGNSENIDSPQELEVLQKNHIPIIEKPNVDILYELIDEKIGNSYDY